MIHLIVMLCLFSIASNHQSVLLPLILYYLLVSH
jgi:hypothetical protein